MRIIDRYLLKGFIAPFLFCVSLLSVLLIVIDAFNSLDEYLKHSVPLSVIASYYLCSLPALLIQIIPVATLVAILYILSNLNKHNEIIALKASGVSAFHILSPYLFMGMLLSFSIFFMNETVVPEATITSRAIKDGLISKGRKHLNERAIEKVTLLSSNHRMVFAREYQVLSQTLHDIVILENTPQQILRSKLTAKKAKYENNEWVFYDVVQYRVDRRGEISGEPSFSEKLVVDLPEKPESFIREASQVEFMSARELKKYIEQLTGSSRKLIRRLWVDFHYKIAVPFLSFIVMLIGAPLAMKTERGSAMVGVGTSFFVVILYYGMQSVCLAMGKGGHLTPFISAWVSNFLFAAVGIYLIKKTA